MPIMDGCTCIRKYREWEAASDRGGRGLIVGSSAHADEDDIKTAWAVGMDDFMPKPVKKAALDSLLAKFDLAG